MIIYVVINVRFAYIVHNVRLDIFWSQWLSKCLFK